MAQYIPKSALVAEIKRRKELVSDPILLGNDLMIGERNAYFNLLSFIDTLELKEVREEPVSEDIDLGCGVIWKGEEPVSEDLEEACEQLAEKARMHKAETISPFFSPTDYKQGLRDGANWKEQQIMAKAIDATVLNGNLIKQKHTTHPLHVGDKVKVIVIKED